MQDYRDDNQLTLPLFSDQALSSDSDYHQNGRQAISRNDNSINQYSQRNDYSTIPLSKEDDDAQARHRFPKDAVEDQNESYQIPVEKTPFKASTISNIPESKVRKFLNPLFLLLIVASLAVMISFRHYQNAQTETNHKSVTSLISYVGSNLAAHPILDIIKLQAGNSCPPDYESALLGVWPGTVHGCHCPDGLTVKPGFANKITHSVGLIRNFPVQKLRVGKCEQSEGPYCHTIPARPPISISHWGGSKWCILRAKPQSQYVQEVSCSKDFRKCSPGLCVLNTLDCPVTKVELKDGSLVKERTQGDLPVIELVITMKDIPYPLVKQREEEEESSKKGLNEKLSIIFYHQRQKELFEENDFPQKVWRMPEFANMSEKADVVLSYRKRMSVAENMACLNIETDMLEESSDLVPNFLKTVSSGSSVLDIAQWLLVVSAIFMVLLFRRFYPNWSFLLQGEGSMSWVCFPGAFAFVQCTLFGTTLGSATSNKAKMVKTHEYLSKLVEAGCFLDQEEVQKAMNGYRTVVDEETGTRLKYSYLLLLLMIFSSIVFGWSLCDAYKKRKTDIERDMKNSRKIEGFEEKLC